MTLGFLDHIQVVPDHRIPGMVTYPLDEILLATLAGRTTPIDIGRNLDFPVPMTGSAATVLRVLKANLPAEKGVRKEDHALPWLRRMLINPQI